MVERYHPTSDSIYLIAPHSRGDYVRYSDYAALEAQLAERVRVKPLEWSKDNSIGGHGGWIGRAGEFTRTVKIGWMVEAPYEFGGQAFASLDDAKAAAQADYERRILSALEATPAPEQRELSAEDVATFDRALLRSGRKAEATPARMVTFPGCVVSLNGTKISMAFETDEDAQTVFRLIDHIIDSTASEAKQ